MPRLPRHPRPERETPALGLTDARIQYDLMARITADWPPNDPRYDALKALLANHASDVRKYEADHIRRYADDPNVKPHLLDGEWTGLRMAANLLHLEKD
jgi:hypothetical protein